MIVCWQCKKETGISIEAYGDHECPYCKVMISVYEDWQDKREQLTKEVAKMMIFEDICTRKTYMKDGIEKVTWLKCGTLRTNDAGKRFIELNQSPDITLFVFPKKEKTNQPEQATEQGWLSEEQQG